MARIEQGFKIDVRMSQIDDRVRVNGLLSNRMIIAPPVLYNCSLT
jgi:hypothetical protein